MSDTTYLQWPFLAEQHRELATNLNDWASQNVPNLVGDHADVDNTCRTLVAALGQAGWLQNCVPAAFGGANEKLDVRSLCVIRDTLARHDGLADFAFAMQGLGSGPISLFADDSIKARYLPDVAAGKKIAQHTM